MHEFFPFYQNINSVSPDKFLGEITAKKEFTERFLHDTKLFPHQKFISRFISPYTLYNDLIVFHEMGSGKTQSAIEVAETLMSNPNSGIIKTIVVVRGKGLCQNFVNELIHRSSYKKYAQEKNLWKKYYKFWTLEVFGKTLSKLSDQDLLNQYNHCLFIVDEAHHLKKHNKGPYNAIHRLFHLLPHRKVLLLTGTPMKDDVSEFSNIANLLLSHESQLPFGTDFNQTFFKDGKLIQKQHLADRLTGYVSFHKGENPSVRKKFEGRIIKPMKHIPVVECPMDSFQKQHCVRAHLIDLQGSVVYINSRQSSLFVFPDGTFGQAGFKKYVKLEKKTDLFGRTTTKYKLTQDLVSAIQTNLGKYSSKYKKVIDIITNNPSAKIFIYSEFVHGSGAILLGEILRLYGYSKATGQETKPGKRFIIATTQSVGSNLVDLIDRFNAEDNNQGEMIQIFIGSQLVSEGFSLRNISIEIILTPHWNFSEIEQIIARGWRINSHTIDIRYVSIYLLVIPISILETYESDFGRYGIDLYMYKTAEFKDFKIKQLERFLKEISIDCHLFKPEPYLQSGSRECDYTDCQVQCYGSQQNPDQASFNVLYLPYQELDGIFSKYFEKHQFMSFKDLKKIVPFDNFILLSYISDLIFTNIPLMIKNKIMFLRKAGSLFYMTEDPTVPIETLTPSILLNDKSINLQDLFTDLHETWLMNSVKLLFESSNPPVKTILSKLPRKYQHLLLTASLYANINQSGNPNIIKKILVYYRGFYHQGDLVYVWLFHEKFGTLTLKITDQTATWIPAQRDIYQEQRDRLYASPVGYYGLYNPQLDEFCLRKVSSVSETDLRRIKVGRRCGDWDQQSLVDLIQNKLALNINVSDYNRAELCKIIKKEFFKRNLVMYNFDCGNQFKIRGRI